MRKATSIALSLLLIVAVAPSAVAETFIVSAGTISFMPKELTIHEGDTVRWVRAIGTHTVTSGTGSADPDAGKLFNAGLSTADPLFEYTFDTAGTYPYFCQIHESSGMTGTITVESNTPVEATTWSRLKRIFEGTDR